MTLDETTRWEPYGGYVRFKVAGIDSINAPEIQACFQWKQTNPTTVPICFGAERAETNPDGSVMFAASVPFAWSDKPPGVLMDTFVPFLPLATLTIRALDIHSPSNFIAPLEVMCVQREIGITNKWISAGLATLFLAAAWLALRFFLKRYRSAENLPSRLLLNMICTRGWASLSQFQILLWTFLIAAGSVYVITLTGSLIVITSGTLGLLGIAGTVAVGSEFRKRVTDAPSDVLAPGPVTNVAVRGNAALDGAVLSWPAAAGTSVKYTVQLLGQGSNWNTLTDGLEHPAFRLVGLEPNQSYTVQVLATNGLGAGKAAQCTFMTATSPSSPPQLSQSQPAAVRDLTMHGGGGADGVLAWTAAPGTQYRLEYRPHDSDLDWQPGRAVASPPGVKLTDLPSLEADTEYDLRVVPFDDRGDAPPSNIVRAGTGPRLPRWSDLIMDDSVPAEVDVTRLQMFIFTAISAFFVGLKIIDSGVIPEIPSSFVTLMGISNGVYLTAKFVRPASK